MKDRKKRAIRRITVNVDDDDMAKINIIMDNESAKTYPDLFRRMMDFYWEKKYYDKRTSGKNDAKLQEEKISSLTSEQKCEALNNGIGRVDKMAGKCVLELFAWNGVKSGEGRIPLVDIDRYYILNVIKGEELVF